MTLSPTSPEFIVLSTTSGITLETARRALRSGWINAAVVYALLAVVSAVNERDGPVRRTVATVVGAPNPTFVVERRQQSKAYAEELDQKRCAFEVMRVRFCGDV